MPTISPPALVLVTGANGYIPIWTVSSFLSRGYSVRGTVRSSAKGDHLLKYFSEYAKEGGKDGVKLELVVVVDITKEGAFDEAVKGVDGIAHMASPFHENVDDPEGGLPFVSLASLSFGG
jgi:nucleoside-diphosphate-sugar epimerase